MLPQPIHYHSDLTHERLLIVAELLLDEYNKTLDDLSSETDDNYTRGCASFGRQKNRIKQSVLANTYPWLQIMNSTNDLVFKIGSIPCRFSNDNPNSPKKKAVLTANRYQMSFFDEIESDEMPCRFCFIIDDEGFGEDEPKVVFIGYDAYDLAKCQWESGAIRTLHNVNPTDIPAPIEIDKPRVKPKKSTEEPDNEADKP